MPDEEPTMPHYAVVAFRKARDLHELAEHRSAWVPEYLGCFARAAAHELAAARHRQDGHPPDVSPCHCARV